jgi:hypothetical protein
MRIHLFTCWLGMLLSTTFASTWEMEVVHNGKQFKFMTDRSLRLDAAGNPHVVYGEDRLYYAWSDGTIWHHEVADMSVHVGLWASLDIDEEGFPHISYEATLKGDLKYAYKDAAGWHTETISWPAGRTSLAVDDAGFPHVAFYEYQYCDLKYAYKDAAGWHIEIVDHVGRAGRYSSLALDQADCPHICYHDATYFDLKYAFIPPSPSIALSAQIVADRFQLTWPSVLSASSYWVYGDSNVPWFAPEMGPGYEYRLTVLPSTTTTWSKADNLGHPHTHWTYLVIAVHAAGSELARSNRVGEHDFEGNIP